MNRKSLFFVLTFLVLMIIGCTSNDKVVVNHPHKNEHLIEKKSGETGATFLTDIAIDLNSFVEISDWYDAESILLLKDENAISYVDRINLKTGEMVEFFQIDEPILSVEANYDYSYFSIQTTAFDLTSSLYFLDHEGEVIYSLSEIGEEFSLFWNPYNHYELIIISFLPNWDFEVYHLNLKEKTLHQLPLEKMYFQWLNEDEIAYLEWSSLAPSFYAPIYKYNLETNSITELLDEVIAFFTFAENTLVAVTVDSLDAENSIYHIYENENQIAELEIPTLNTYSEQWWIPFHEYDPNHRSFYYLRPLYSDDFFRYNEPFELTKFNVETNREEKIVDVDLQAPIKLSPDGSWMLYGNQLEWLIDLTNKSMRLIVD